MRTPLLSKDHLKEHLSNLPDWVREDKTISRTFQFSSFANAIEFVTKVAVAAEAMDHHPDIDVRYRKVTLALTTHDSGGLTLNDVNLAAACDDLAQESCR